MPKRRKDSDADGNSKKSKSNSPGVHDESNTTNTSAIPIFLKKTYRMIETCNPEICSWSDDGGMFIVKNPEVFASDIIPQYFDHNKFSSFARQLNFYGFRKIQTKPIRNEDFDKSTAKHVTFYNEKFKRGRYDLLKDIQRSTRGGGAQASLADQQREMETLRSTVANLENRVQELESRWSELTMKMEREIQAKFELAVMDMFSSSGRQGLNPTSTLQAAQYNMGMPSLPTSFGDASILQRAERSFGSIGRNTSELGGAWQNPLLQGSQAARAFSTASASSLSGQGGGNKGGGAGSGGVTGSGGGNNGGGNAGGQSAGDAAAASGGTAASATLPPHPKQKSLPPPPANMGGVPQSASGGLRNLSSGGLNLQGGGGNSMLLRNAWEDKFFSTLMMTDGASRAASLAGLNPGMAGGNASGLAALAAAQQAQNQQRMMAQVQAQAQAQAQMNAGKGGAVGGGGGGPEAGGSDNLQRQTTAEILLEAAGELGGARGGGAPGKVGDKGKGGNDGPDGKEVGV